MAVLFAGTRLEHFTAGQVPTDANPFSAEHTTAFVDSAFVSAGVRVRYGSYISAEFAEQQTMSIGFRLHMEDPPDSRNDDPLVELYDAAGDLVLAMDTDNGVCFLKWGDRSTKISPNVVPTDGSVTHFVIQYSRDATTGKVRLFRDTRLIIDFEGDTTWGTTTGIASFRLHAARRWTQWDTFSEVVVLDELGAVGHRLCDILPNAAGFHSGWTGAFGDVTDGSTGTTLSTGTAGTLHSFAASDTVAGDWNVEALIVGAEGTTGGSPAPENATLGVRVSGTDYFAAATMPLDGQGHNSMWTTNPATGLAWTPAEVDAVELLIRAET